MVTVSNNRTQENIFFMLNTVYILIFYIVSRDGTIHIPLKLNRCLDERFTLITEIFQ